MDIPKAIETKPSYENFEARCPACEYWNIFNRATDIGSFRLIMGKSVFCQNEDCKKELWIGYDYASPAWQMMILDCGMLRKQKRYAYCILNLCQAFEMYFGLHLRATFIYRPFMIEGKSDEGGDIDHLNKIIRMLFDKTNSWSYVQLRNIFIRTICEDVQCNTLADGESAIGRLRRNTKEPTDEEILKIKNRSMAEALIDLKSNTINSLRNKVVHKSGYRPTLQEAEAAEEETTRILYEINNLLGRLHQKYYMFETIV